MYQFLATTWPLLMAAGLPVLGLAGTLLTLRTGEHEAFLQRYGIGLIAVAAGAFALGVNGAFAASALICGLGGTAAWLVLRRRQAY